MPVKRGVKLFATRDALFVRAPRQEVVDVANPILSAQLRRNNLHGIHI